MGVFLDIWTMVSTKVKSILFITYSRLGIGHVDGCVVKANQIGLDDFVLQDFSLLAAWNVSGMIHTNQSAA